MVDVTMPLPDPKTSTIKHLEGRKTPTILLINKVDLVDKENLLPIIEAYQDLFSFNRCPKAAYFKFHYSTPFRASLMTLKT